MQKNKLSCIKQQKSADLTSSAEYVNLQLLKWNEDHKAEDKIILQSYLNTNIDQIRDHTIITKFGYDMTTMKLSSLSELRHVDPDIVNFAMSMENDRQTSSQPPPLPQQQQQQQQGKKKKKMHFFSCSFFDSLVESDHFKGAKKQKKINVFKLDKIFIPILLEQLQWALVVVNVYSHKLLYYNSMYSNGIGLTALTTVLNWLTSEAKSRNVFFNAAQWDFSEGGRGIPQQLGICDSGIFVILYTDFIARGLSVTLIDNTKTTHYKEKIALWIVKGKFARISDSVETAPISLKRPRENDLMIDDHVKTACLLLEFSNNFNNVK
jgi:Ulp1 family protease